MKPGIFHACRYHRAASALSRPAAAAILSPGLSLIHAQHAIRLPSPGRGSPCPCGPIDPPHPSTIPARGPEFGLYPRYGTRVSPRANCLAANASPGSDVFSGNEVLLSFIRLTPVLFGRGPYTPASCGTPPHIRPTALLGIAPAHKPILFVMLTLYLSRKS